MRLRTWGILLLLLGLATMAGGSYGIAKARAWSGHAKDGCAPEDGIMCGEGKTYLFALGLALLPLVTMPATLLIMLGAILWGLDVARARSREARPRPPNG